MWTGVWERGMPIPAIDTQQRKVRKSNKVTQNVNSLVLKLTMIMDKKITN